MSSPHVTAYRLQPQHAGHLGSLEHGGGGGSLMMAASPSRRYPPMPPPAFAASSLDCNSTNPSGGASPFATRSINLPVASSLVAPFSPTALLGRTNDCFKQPQQQQQWGSPVKHRLQADSVLAPLPIHAMPIAGVSAQQAAAPVVFQSNLGASLAAHRVAGFHVTTTTTSTSPPTTLTTSSSSPSPLASLTLQRHESVPSSVGSAMTVSPGSQSPLTSAAVSPSPSPMAASSSSSLSALASTPPLDVAVPCPISLWYGCEDAAHARAVIATYASHLCSQRAANSRAPLEFIGRVKRERLDVAKLHRLIDQHLMLTRAGAPRRRLASAAGTSTPNRTTSRKGSHNPSRFDAFPSPSSSLCDSRFAGPCSSSPLHSLPPLGSFATLDLVSIYARDTLPLGLVFPLIRHEWVATVWNTEDGVQESSVRIHTEYEQVDDEEEDEPDEEELAAKAVLALYARACFKPAKLGLGRRNSNDRRNSAVLSPASRSSSSSSVCSDASSSAAVAASSSSLWHPASSPFAIAGASAANTNPVPLQPKATAAEPEPEPRTTTCFLYNLPIFSEDCDGGSFNTFGCKVVRPLGSLGPAKPKSKPKRQARQSAAAPSEQPQLQLPSGLGYSGSQNDCVYNCLVGLGRKVKCNSSAASSDSCGEAQAISQEIDLAAAAAEAAAAAQITADAEAIEATRDNDAAVDDEDEDEDDSTSDESDVESESDLAGLESDSDADDFVPTRTQSATMAIQQPARRHASHAAARSVDDDDDDDDCGYSDSNASSFADSFVSPSGSLRDELAAQLQALSGGFGARKK